MQVQEASCTPDMGLRVGSEYTVLVAQPSRDEMQVQEASCRLDMGMRVCSEYSVSVAQPRILGMPLEASLAAHQQINCCQWISSYTERLRGTTLSVSG